MPGKCLASRLFPQPWWKPHSEIQRSGETIGPAAGHQDEAYSEESSQTQQDYKWHKPIWKDQHKENVPGCVVFKCILFQMG